MKKVLFYILIIACLIGIVIAGIFIDIRYDRFKMSIDDDWERLEERVDGILKTQMKIKEDVRGLELEQQKISSSTKLLTDEVFPPCDNGWGWCY